MCKALPYFDLVHCRPVPIAHAFLFGVMGDFISSAFTDYKVTEGPPGPWVVPFEKRKQIAELYASSATHLHDKDAPFSFIYKKKDSGHYVSGLGSARMVDVEQFVCIYGPTVLADAWENPAYYKIFMALHDAYVGIFDRDTQAAGKTTDFKDACDRCARLAATPRGSASTHAPQAAVFSV